MNKLQLSVIVPCYNEQDNIENLWARLEPVLISTKLRWEAIFVDDGSTDNTLSLLHSIADRFPNSVKVVELAHNSGQHPAVFAGMAVSCGDVVVTLDADLQNPPEEIPRLLEAMSANGWEVVGSVRKNRHDNIFRKAASRLVAGMARKITKVKLKDWGSMLRAYSRPVVNRMVEHPEHSTYIPALATIYTKKVGEITVAHEGRNGHSRYSLGRLIDLYLDLMTSFSDYPLKFMFYSGLWLAFIGFLLAGILMYGRIVYGSDWAVEGVFTLFSVLFFLIGAQFFALGLLGQYIVRIYREVRKRPPYVVKDVYTANSDSKHTANASQQDP